jgi:hypothetical protein
MDNFLLGYETENNWAEYDPHNLNVENNDINIDIPSTYEYVNNENKNIVLLNKEKKDSKNYKDYLTENNIIIFIIVLLLLFFLYKYLNKNKIIYPSNDFRAVFKL